jgi:hypothetical protein
MWAAAMQPKGTSVGSVGRRVVGSSFSSSRELAIEAWSSLVADGGTPPLGRVTLGTDETGRPAMEGTRDGREENLYKSSKYYRTR